MGRFAKNSSRISVAPMMEWTDRHYRFMARLLSPKVWLYTEMIHARAVIHGDRPRLLGFDPVENPLALQLGGENPSQMAEAGRIGEDWGYDEININCGCPSDRVASGSFGACLMAAPEQVGHIVSAMKKALSIPVTVKCRIGIDGREDYAHLKDFSNRIIDAGCDRIIVHARIAVLGGLSPAENRTIPPLRYNDVYRLKDEFSDTPIEINGGIRTIDEIRKHYAGSLDGVMIGRAAYENPWILTGIEDILSESPRNDGQGLACKPDLPGAPDLFDVIDRMNQYIIESFDRGVPANAIARHMLGLMHGRPGAREFRRKLSGDWSRKLTDSRILGDYLESVRANAMQAGIRQARLLESVGN